MSQTLPAKPSKPKTLPVPHVKAIALESVALPALRPAAARDLFNWVVAAVMFVPAVPLMLLAMLAVKLTSRGPAVYQQTRLGRGGVPFTIYKVRTMRTDAEKDGKPQWSKRGDPRITPVGRFLRATHLDELPQLWNVLRGEMNIVGPRPERPEIIALLRQAIPGYDRRLTVKPGVTGFAQIHLPADETISSVRRKLTYDLFYLRRAGVVFDFGILVCTALKVVGLKRVYCRK